MAVWLRMMSHRRSVSIVGAGWIVHAYCSLGHRADVHHKTGNALPCVRDRNGPYRRVHIFREIVDLTGVAHLTTTFDIKWCFRQDNFDF